MNKDNLQNIIKILFILILISQTVLVVKAQEGCGFVLKRAEKLYEEGVIEAIPQLLENCMKKGFTKEEKIRAYKLLILTNLYEDRQNKADKLMLELIKFEPLFITFNDIYKLCN